MPADDPRPVLRRRSVLYVPGSNTRALDKAADLPVDAVVVDLEDAVADDRKDDARAEVVTRLGSAAFGSREVAVRINGIDRPWFDADVQALAAAAPSGVLLPKVQTPDDLRHLETCLTAAGAPTSVRLWAMLETPQAVLDAPAIARATPRLAVLVIGTNDLVDQLGAADEPGRGPLLTSLSWCVLAARAAGVSILDGVFADLADEDGLRAECRQAWALGFDGKTLVHPNQIAPCHDVFRPDAAELARARALIDAFEAAGQGVIRFQGRMVEQLHVEQARRLLADADGPTGT